MTTYALLVGIDAYQSPVRPLNGCVADVSAMHAVVESRIAKAELDIHVLLNEQATRANVIEEFRGHLGNASAGDSVIFWYSGHGSRQPSAAASGLEPDGLDETLVLHDSRQEGGFDLADKELGALIADIAKPGVHVFVGLDCCHAGSGTREILADDVGVRHAPTDNRTRDRTADSYLVTSASEGRHVLLAACRFDQTAKEVPIAGVRRGAMTLAVERAIAGAGPGTTYRQLHRAVRASVAQLTTDQVPQLEVTVDEDSAAILFDGALNPRKAGYVLTFDGSRWAVDAGAVQGIPPVSTAGTTHFEVRDQDGEAVVGHAVVTEVGPDSSLVAVDTELNRSQIYTAVVTAVPLPRTRVVAEGVGQDVVDAVDGSPYLEVAGSGDLTLRTCDGGVEIIDAGRGDDPVARVPNVPSLVAASLEQIVRWRQLLILDNPGSGLTDVVLDVIEEGADTPVAEGDPRHHAGDEIVLEYRGSANPRFTATVHNNGAADVYCAVLALSESYRVASFLPGSVATKLKPGERVTTPVVTGSIPDDLWKAGVSHRTDILKLIVSEDQFEPNVLAQAGLTQPVLDPDRGEVDDPPASTLGRLLRRVQNRDLSIDPGPEAVVDWSASSLRVVIERLQPGLVAGGSTSLADGVSMETPEGFRATASLSGSDVVARDLYAPMVPVLLADDPEQWKSFGLLPIRDAAAPLDVLELRDVDGSDAVTPDTPITLTLDQSIADDETVLVIGFDGLNYLVVGHSVRRPTTDPEERSAARGTTIRVEQLPDAIDTRSLTGSIRLLFRRFARKLTGGPIDVTRLAVATVNGDEVTYDDDLVSMKEAVAQAERILLLVHGILGDTAGMVVGGAKGIEQIDGFGRGYDLVLAFDYENINTPIDQTAASLRRKLTEAGATSKQLDVVAHSMGGLVTRWMIEQDGAGLVSHLITAGTPNGGSPWPVIEGWATATLSFGLNKLQQVFWPASLLSGLVALVEGVDRALDDMEPASASLATLYDSDDPKVRYTVLVGDRSLPGGDLAPSGRVEQILRQIKRTALDAVTAVAFLRQPNDLAVSFDSAVHLPANRSPAPRFVTSVACDHLTFFSSRAGLEALAAAAAELN